MKMTKTVASLTPVALLLMAVAGGVNAAPAAPGTDQGHGRITFNGSVINAPCSIDAKSLDQTVELGVISMKKLAAGGKSTAVPVNIQLRDCSIETVKGTKITFNGTAGDSASGLDGSFAITGQAKGVGVVITDLNGTVIKPATASDIKLIGGDNELQFQAYVQGSSVADAVVPGAFASVANFMMAYE